LLHSGVVTQVSNFSTVKTSGKNIFQPMSKSQVVVRRIGKREKTRLKKANP